MLLLFVRGRQYPRCAIVAVLVVPVLGEGESNYLLYTEGLTQRQTEHTVSE